MRCSSGLDRRWRSRFLCCVLVVGAGWRRCGGATRHAPAVPPRRAAAAAVPPPLGRGRCRDLCALHEARPATTRTRHSAWPQSWLGRGGAHPADHCAAVALITLGKYKEGATRLQALAQAMTTAPAALRAEVLDQAGQAWLLAGDPVRAYAAAGEAVALAPGDPESADRPRRSRRRGRLSRSRRRRSRPGAEERPEPGRRSDLPRLGLSRARPARPGARRHRQGAGAGAAFGGGVARARQHPPPRRRSATARAATGRRSARSLPAARKTWPREPISSIWRRARARCRRLRRSAGRAPP